MNASVIDFAAVDDIFLFVGVSLARAEDLGLLELGFQG